MNRQEHLLTIAMEECCEVAQRISKAKRFGMKQVQQDANDKPEENPERLTNRERIMAEYSDLVAVMGMAGLNLVDPQRVGEKMAKVERYLIRSRDNGTLTD